MLISIQLFDRITGISDETSRRATVLPVGCRRMPERRQAARLAYGHRTQLCRDGGKKAGVWDTVMMQDISVKGIGYISDEPMTIGETFVLKLLDKEGQTIRIRCKVTRCEAGGFGQSAFLVGASFEQVIQHVLRVNDDDGETGFEVRSVETGAACVTVASDSTRLKTAGVAMARAAVGLLKAVDPSQWIRRDDDFSSAG
jgi:hypothetical protein